MPMGFGWDVESAARVEKARQRPGWAGETGDRSTDEWLTPPDLIAKLGAFELDPCSPKIRPWDTAARHFTSTDHGLIQDWDGRVWLNPPYSQVGLWMDRAALHGRATCLVFARTDTQWWIRHVWQRAHGVAFLAGRLRFFTPDGHPAAHTAGSPSALVCYGADDVRVVRQAVASGAVPGCFLELRHEYLSVGIGIGDRDQGSGKREEGR